MYQAWKKFWASLDGGEKAVSIACAAFLALVIGSLLFGFVRFVIITSFVGLLYIVYWIGNYGWAKFYKDFIED